MNNKGTILVVDDMLPNLLLIKEALTINGYQVLSANCGTSALAVLEKTKPNLILLDVMMPQMSGFELCKIIRNNKSTEEIPIIFLSAQTDVASRVFGLKAGGNDYLIKPFHDEELLARVETHIQLAQLKKKEQINIEELKVSEHKFRAVFEQAAIGVAVLNTSTGAFVQINQKYCDMVGYTIPEMLQKTFMDITFSGDVNANVSLNEKFITGDSKEFSFEKRYVHKNGNLIWGNLTISPLWKMGEVPKTYYHVAIVENINDRKNAEIALQKSEEKFRIITENTSDVIWKMNPLTGQFTYVSPSVFKLRGYTPEEIMVQPVSDALTPESAEVLKKIIPINLTIFKEGNKKNNFFVNEVDQPHKDGRIIHTEVTTSYLCNEQNEIEIIGISRDITERRKNEDKLKKSALHQKYQLQQINILNENLNSKNNELEQLIYLTSHDLRSPLVNIQGFSDELNHSCNQLIESLPALLNNNANIEQIHKYTQIEIPEALFYIDQSCAKMNMLIDGLLKVSRLGKLVVNASKIDMNKFIKTVLSIYEFKIKEKQIEIYIENLPDCEADENLLNQVISNIIDNAIKFMPEQEKKQIKISGISENEHCIYCIEDNGMGISPTHLKNIFVIFQKEDQDTQGEGLGLTIAAKIIEKHKGKIWVESEKNKGSKFFIQLKNAMSNE